MSQSEPRNPCYFLLLLASLLFLMTALAYALWPTLEQKALESGQDVPPSPFRDALQADGWRWLLYELAAMFLFGVLSMVVDRIRSVRKERAEAAAAADKKSLPS